MIDYKTLQLYGKDTIIRAKADGTHQILDQLENEACFYFVLEGRSTLHTLTTNLAVERSEGVVLQCGNYLGNFYTNSPNSIVDILIVKMNREVVRQIYQDDFGSVFENLKDTPPFEVQKMESNPQLKQYVESLIFYIENTGYAVEELIILKIKELILLLANSSEKAVIKRVLESLYNPQQVIISQVIQQNLIGPLSIKEMAHICAMSLSTFQRRFRATYKEPPKQYLLRHRMNWAARCLQHAEISIGDISDKLGYSDVSNFSIAFKKFHGVSPSLFGLKNH